MISKYFLWTSVLIVNILLFSSCLGSSDDNIEYSPDAQVYAISLSSKADTTGLLPGVVFTIDQVNKKIFNKKPLPYLFHVDSVMLGVTGSSSYYPFYKIDIKLAPDSTYTWNQMDSIPISRLLKIITTAPDAKTTREYDFQLNIYDKDPYIINWENITANYLTTPAVSQRTIAFNGSFYTYYLSGTEMKAVSTSASSDGKNWNEVNLSGIPSTIRLSSLIISGNNIYALDGASGSVYRSTNGINWSSLPTTYEVKAIYGNLPFATSNTILVAVNHDGKLKFAQTDNNFSTVNLKNDIPANMPITDFSTINIESGSSYATKFIVLAGGNTAGNSPNNDIWLLQENEGVITYVTSKKPNEGTMKGSSLFFYDEKPYLITTSAGKNLLMYSENYGLDWITAGENQSFPAGFTLRTNASVITDTNNYIWIFGGISSSNTQIVDIWKGRLNRFSQD